MIQAAQIGLQLGQAMTRVPLPAVQASRIALIAVSAILIAYDYRNSQRLRASALTGAGISLLGAATGGNAVLAIGQTIVSLAVIAAALVDHKRAKPRRRPLTLPQVLPQGLPQGLPQAVEPPKALGAAAAAVAEDEAEHDADSQPPATPPVAVVTAIAATESAAGTPDQVAETFQLSKDVVRPTPIDSSDDDQDDSGVGFTLNYRIDTGFDNSQALWSADGSGY